MIYQGDCVEVLKRLPEASVHTCVTSPPYWSLRDYGVPPSIWGGKPRCAHEWESAGSREGYTSKKKWQHEVNGQGERQTASAITRKTNPDGWNQIEQGQFCVDCGAWRGCLGLEPTPELYVEHLVTVFDQVRRVLRRDGTFWLNLGDCFNSQPGDHRNVGLNERTGRAVGQRKQEHSQPRPSYRRDRRPMGNAHHRTANGLKPKDLVGIPWMVAFALRARGWYLRMDNIWAKTNPMPESIKDRPTKSHEYVFLLAKSEGYFYDADAVREPHKAHSIARAARARTGGKHLVADSGEPRNNPQSLRRQLSNALHHGGRNWRSVWTLPTSPFPGAHFATFPQRLVEPCILAGTSAHGCCSACGAPFRRIVELGDELRAQKLAGGSNRDGEYHGHARKDYAAAGAQDPSAVKARILAGMRERVTVGWKPTCRHTLRDIVPCTVLDPFAGVLTTKVVADRLGRAFIGIELNPDYIEMGERRTAPALRKATA